MKNYNLKFENQNKQLQNNLGVDYDDFIERTSDVILKVYLSVAIVGEQIKYKELLGLCLKSWNMNNKDISIMKRLKYLPFFIDFVQYNFYRTK